MIYYKNSSELYHHGILGQKWGVRRFQNPDGTLTKAGKKRYTTNYSRYNPDVYPILNRRGKRLEQKAEQRAKKIINTDKGRAIVRNRWEEINEKLDALNKAEEKVIRNGDPDKVFDLDDALIDYAKAGDSFHNLLKELTKDIAVDLSGDFRRYSNVASEYEIEVNRLIAQSSAELASWLDATNKK